jgi:hypothetical protein
VHVAQCVRAAGNYDHHHRGVRVHQLSEQVCLDPRQSETLSVAAFTGRPLPEQARQVTYDGHTQVRIPGSGQRSGEAGPVVPSHITARLVINLNIGQLSPQRVDRGLDLDTEPEARVARQHMIGERVATHERPGVGRARSGHCDPPQRWTPLTDQGQRRPGVEEDDGPLGDVPSEGAVGERVEVDRSRVGDGAFRRPVRVEQPELHLLGEQPPGRPVDQRLPQLAT